MASHPAVEARFAGRWAEVGDPASSPGEGDADRSSRRPPLGPVIGPFVGAGIIALVRPGSPAVLLLAALGAGLVLLVAVRPDAVRRLDRGLRAGARRVGGVLSTVGFSVLSIAFVGIPWAVGRLLRWDTTWAPRTAGSAWVPAAHGEVPSRRPWARTASPSSWPASRRAHLWAIRLLLVGLLLVGAVTVLRRQAQAPDPNLIAAPAMAGADYWPELYRAQEQLRTEIRLNSFAYVQPDVSSPYLNIEDGRRVTWTPPDEGGCRPTVWVFGGSTVFGEGQRDDHTIASELARLAWEDGVALEVQNHGVMGDPHWVAARRFELALAEAPTPPDHVVFYDGANEVITRILLDQEGLAARDPLVSYLDAGVFRVLDRFLRPAYRFIAESDALQVEQPASTPLDDGEVARLAARQYALGVASSRRIAASAQVDAVWFNQPTRWTRTPRPGESAWWSDEERTGRAVTAGFLQQLPDGVIDLSDRFDAVEEEVFYDPAHTNERGARLVAASLWEEIGPRLTSRCEQEGAGCC